MVISVSCGFVGGVITVTNAKSSSESEKFTLKIRSESGKLFTIGCHFPPKSTNFGTLVWGERGGGEWTPDGCFDHCCDDTDDVRRCGGSGVRIDGMAVLSIGLSIGLACVKQPLF